jgi:DNA-binding NarL/FixJ family response regulator
LVPDIALVGATLTDGSGLWAARELPRRFPAMEAIVIAHQETDDDLFAAMRAGAAAYCGLEIDETTLIALIRRVATGEHVITERLLDNPRVAAKVLEQFRTATSTDPKPRRAPLPLDELELKVIRMVFDGITKEDIGHALGISAQDVTYLMRSISKKRLGEIPPDRKSGDHEGPDFDQRSPDDAFPLIWLRRLSWCAGFDCYSAARF